MPISSSAPSAKPELRQGSNNRNGRTLLILLLVSAVLFTLHVREGGAGPITSVRSAFQFVTTPIRSLGAALTYPVHGLGNIVANITADQQTLSELKEENEQLRSKNAELEESVKTTERLEELLQLRGTYSLESTAARIISASTDSWTATVTIDKGSTEGIAVGMPVTDSKGAIGQVIETSPASAVVRLVSDENSGVSAMVQSNRAQGVLSGSANGTLHLDLIRTDQEVEVGDYVVTSGLGGVFPKGIPIGIIASVEKSPGSLYYEIVVDPLSAVETYEEVLVITSTTEEQRATAEDIQEADAQDSKVDLQSELRTEPVDGESGKGTAQEAGSAEASVAAGGSSAG